MPPAAAPLAAEPTATPASVSPPPASPECPHDRVIDQLASPMPGRWTFEDWAAIDAAWSRSVELVEGCLEFLPTPGAKHLRLQKRIERLIEAILGIDGPLEVTNCQWKFRIADDGGRYADAEPVGRGGTIDSPLLGPAARGGRCLRRFAIRSGYAGVTRHQATAA